MRGWYFTSNECWVTHELKETSSQNLYAKFIKTLNDKKLLTPKARIMQLDFYGWGKDGMKENPSDVPSDDVFILREQVLEVLDGAIPDLKPHKKITVEGKSKEQILDKYPWHGFQHSRNKEHCLLAMEEYASQFRTQPSNKEDMAEFHFTESQFSKFIEWCRVNGERHRGNLQKNGIQLYQQYLKETV